MWAMTEGWLVLAKVIYRRETSRGERNEGLERTVPNAITVDTIFYKESICLQMLISASELQEYHIRMLEKANQ